PVVCQPYPVAYPPWVVAPVPPPVVAAPTETFVSPKGRSYRMTREAVPPYPFDRAVPTPPGSAPISLDDFGPGHDRGDAKTTPAAGDPGPTIALNELLDDLDAHFPDDM